jgi:hypothetical protein
MPTSNVIGDVLLVRAGKIAVRSAAATYGTVRDVYGKVSIQVDARLINAVREGDGKRLAAVTRIVGGTVTLEFAANNLQLFADMLGLTYSVTGSTPNQVGKLQFYNSSLPYFGFIAGADDDNGLENAFHVWIPKLKITSDTFTVTTLSGNESPEFANVSIECEAFADEGYNTGAANEVQTLTITGTPTGGTFTLIFGSETTSALDFDFTAAEIDTALEALDNIGAGDVTCSGGPLPGTPVVITFGGNLANAKMPLMTTDDALLTGGTDPTATVARTTTGAEGNDLIFTIYEDEQGTEPLLPPAL